MNSYTDLTAIKALIINYHRFEYELLERRHLFADMYSLYLEI